VIEPARRAVGPELLVLGLVEPELLEGAADAQDAAAHPRRVLPLQGQRVHHLHLQRGETGGKWVRVDKQQRRC